MLNGQRAGAAALTRLGSPGARHVQAILHDHYNVVEAISELLHHLAPDPLWVVKADYKSGPPENLTLFKGDMLQPGASVMEDGRMQGIVTVRAPLSPAPPRRRCPVMRPIRASRAGPGSVWVA